MDFDESKENIQPLAQGRNASILHASLRVESPQELLAQRKVLEKEIHDYIGDDPLSVWYNYIEWIEQSFPSGGKESGLQEVLSKCLSQFESDDRYKQDRRMIKLYIKFIDSHKDPAECYQQLFNAGIGSMIADFYIAWAYCYDLVGNSRKADEIFLRGIACRAQPLEDLQEARQHFGFSVAQRLMYKDDDPIREETTRQLNERRVALTSLRAHRRKHVGSIRTGSAVKNVSPGKVKVDLPSTSFQRGNLKVQVFKDENENPKVLPSLPDSISTNEPGKSVVRSIIDAARDQENKKEPGPWNKAHTRQKGKLFGGAKAVNELGFEIHEDELIDDSENVKKSCNPPIPIADSDIKFDKPFVYLPNFCAISKSIKGWITAVTTEEKPDANTLPEYNKCKLYPRPNMEFQPEELKAYNILKKRGIQNNFTNERDVYWGSGPLFKIRLYPHFAKSSLAQTTDTMDLFFMPEKVPGLKVAFDEIYNKEREFERQFEEILALRIKRNETITETADMEETMCITSEKFNRRKSFFPMRKSIAPASYKSLIQTSNEPEQNEFVEKPPAFELPSNVSFASANAKNVEEMFEAKPEVTQNINTLETVELETKPSLVSKIAAENEQSKEQLQTVTEEDVCKAVSPIPFEIFLDESTVIPKCIKNVPDEDEFKFKTPALPIVSSTSIAAKPRKLPFEIFDDENYQQNKQEFASGAGSYFDADETCSTHTFNIFLKAQSVSTPKSLMKAKPQRQFGNILKEVPPSNPKEEAVEIQDQISTDEVCAGENENITPLPSTTNVCSPPRQRLSTILETSEQGTTQGTHTTGATTKSTFSSPEFDLESQVIATANVGSDQQHTVLEPVKELSCETSIDKMIENLKIESTDKSISKSLTSTKNIETPVAMRLQNKYTTEKSILEFSINTDEKQVGNFSRLEEKEDTSAGIAFKTLPSIRFQDDKTETFPKMLITSQQVKFQDEKTETISKILFEPTIPLTNEDNTETVSKIFLDPPPSVKFSEDKTETISKFMFQPPEFKKFEDEKAESKQLGICKTLQKGNNVDDSFEFFGLSPPRSIKQLQYKQAERGYLSQVRTADQCRTPIPIDSKRFCGNITASGSKTNILFKDELKPDLKSKPSANINKNIRDSISSDFLLVEEKQQKLAKPKGTSVFRDSFIPDFSLIEDSQPQVKQIQSKSQDKASANESILPEFSFTKNTKPMLSQRESNNPSDMPNAFNFSYVPETQHKPGPSNSGNVSIVTDILQTKQAQSKSQDKATANESVIPEFSFTKNTKPMFSQRESNNPSGKPNALNFSYVPETQHKPGSSNSGNVSIVTDILQTKPIQSTSQLKTTLNESNLPEFSLIKHSKPMSSQPEKNNPNGMSTALDFSYVPETQPDPEPSNSDNVSIVHNFSQTKQIQSNSQLKTTMNKSNLPEFSFIKNAKPMSSQPEKNNPSGMSMASDFFHVSKTQPNEYIVKSSQPTESRNFQQTMLPPSSATKIDGTSNLETYKTGNDIIWKQTSEPNIVSQDGTTMKNILMDNFMKDFSYINEPLLIPNNGKKTPLVKSYEQNSSLRFLDESLKKTSVNSKTTTNPFKIDNLCAGNERKLKFLASECTEDKTCSKNKLPCGTDIDKYFELNCETEMFGTNISMIKNSTWLPNHGPLVANNPYQAEQIQEKSLHIKCEDVSTASITAAEISNQIRTPEDLSPGPKFCVDEKPHFNNDLSIELCASELAVINAKSLHKNEGTTIVIPESPEGNNEDSHEMSIYYKQTPKTPKAQLHVWDDSKTLKPNDQNYYVHAEPELNHTQQLIENIAIDTNVNPFNIDLINAFLEQHYVISYLESLPTCKLVGYIQRLRAKASIDINGISIDVIKLIGEGAYGAVFCGKVTSTGKLVALKQEKPPNFWEYYICLEVQERINCDEMLQSYMSVDYALIGNNSSILVSNFSNYGSLITVCNKIKKQTMKNVDEYVVMLLASELLEIIDHLHAVNIIHADVKADNFLLMNKLTYPPTQRHLQLIDFGVSIDMKLFKDGQTFSFVHNENSFKCPEMRENHPWSYQLDLYGLAGAIHVLLFGKYMDIERNSRGFWMHKTHVPRYINKTLWNEIFHTLLNIRDCKSMPNLQDLRALLKNEMVEKESYMLKMVNGFNTALSIQFNEK